MTKSQRQQAVEAFEDTLRFTDTSGTIERSSEDRRAEYKTNGSRISGPPLTLGRLQRR